MESDFFREGSVKDGEEVGLLEEGGSDGGVRGCGRGGKSTSEDNDGKGKSVVCEAKEGKELCIIAIVFWGGGLSKSSGDSQAK